MKYAEAVKRMKYLVEFSRDWTTGTAEDLEALSVLHRAEGVMEAVEGATERDLHVECFGQMTATSHAILRESLRYKETP